MIIDVAGAIKKRIQEDIKPMPCDVNRASSIGHPCLKHLVHMRLDWEKAKLPTPELQMIFQEGHNQERQVVIDMLQAGIKVEQQQVPLSWDKYKIRGSIDGIIREGNEEIPFDIKSMSPYSFKQINSDADMYSSKRHYIRGYLAQMSIYLLLKNKELGLFILKDKSSGQIKQIEYSLVMEYAEQLIKKAELINGYVDRKEYPNPIEYDESICGMCSYNHICNPVKVSKDTETIIDNDFIELLERRNELKPLSKELNEIEKTIKSKVENIKEVVAGNWLLTWNTQQRKAFEIPAQEIKTLKIRKIKEK
jgi:CRISPR/Cas system-associated exonuclease Cas4 (RecB family)